MRVLAVHLQRLILSGLAGRLRLSLAKPSSTCQDMLFNVIMRNEVKASSCHLKAASDYLHKVSGADGRRTGVLSRCSPGPVRLPGSGA